jgi:putative chitinase
VTKGLGKLTGNAGVVAGALIAAGLSSKAQANILAQVESESNFRPRSENLNYSTPEAIQKTFGKNRIPTLEFAKTLVNNPEALANHVYAKTDGNSQPGDGWKYRGRGFLQHTGKNQYEAIKKYTGIDVVTNPDLLNDPVVAAKAIPWFFLEYKKRKPEQLRRYFCCK